MKITPLFFLIIGLPCFAAEPPKHKRHRHRHKKRSQSPVSFLNIVPGAGERRERHRRHQSWGGEKKKEHLLGGYGLDTNTIGHYALLPVPHTPQSLSQLASHREEAGEFPTGLYEVEWKTIDHRPPIQSLAISHSRTPNDSDRHSPEPNYQAPKRQMSAAVEEGPPQKYEKLKEGFNWWRAMCLVYYGTTMMCTTAVGALLYMDMKGE